MKLRLLLASALACTMLLMNNCRDDFSCTDGKQNQGETGIDCGGPCVDCIASCTDGIQNQDETGIDCGGSCPNACPSCSDGIQNQGEAGIDCGGPCPACVVESDGDMTATVNGTAWTATNVAATGASGTTLNMIGTAADGSTINITFQGTFAVGTYVLTAASIQAANGDACSADPASTEITFTTFNVGTGTVSGTFSFACTTAGSPGTTYIVSGTFTDVVYL